MANDVPQSDRITRLEHQGTVILVLSGINLFANLATIAVAILAALLP